MLLRMSTRDSVPLSSLTAIVLHFYVGISSRRRVGLAKLSYSRVFSIALLLLFFFLADVFYVRCKDWIL